MTLILLNALEKKVQGEFLFRADHLKAGAGERVGIIGRNGSGKSTLAKIIAGKDTAYTGNLVVQGDLQYVPQIAISDNSLSGGQVEIAALRTAIAKNPAILVLDEPTANLDEGHQNWLCKCLLKYHGLLLVISHDRNLLTQIASCIWEIKDKCCSEFRGSYENYVVKSEKNYQQQTNLYRYQIKKQKEIAAAVQRKKQKAASVRKGKKMGRFERKDTKNLRETTAARMEKNAHKMLKQSQRANNVEKPQAQFEVKVLMASLPAFKGKTVVDADRMMLTHNKEKLLEQTSFKVKPGEKIALTGPNGSGKSTLLNAIFNHEKNIFVSKDAKIGIFKQNLITLPLQENIADFVRRKTVLDIQFVRRFMGALGLPEKYWDKKIGSLSGGELCKLQLVIVLTSEKNFLLLDEPTNFLDVVALHALEEFLMRYPGTLVFVSHDKSFCRHIATRTLSIYKHHLVDFAKEEVNPVPKTDLPLLRLEYDRALLDPKVNIAQLRTMSQKIKALEKN